MKTFKAKVSYGLLIPIILLIIVEITWLFAKPQINTNAFLTIAILLATVALILILFLKTVYTINGDKLIIKSSFLYSKQIDIHAIKTIRKSRDLTSSPAPSLDRLEISYGKLDSILISPLRKRTFVTSLKEINSDIESDII
ncbi:MAG: hypothetical protein ACI9Z3_001222 [Roseivirga sp.]|jgi:hypothetical protein